MECNPKIPGQIVPTPLFPDGRGEIIKVLLPFKECNVESNYLNGLIKSTIKRNKPKIDCKKPQKSKEGESTQSPQSPQEPYLPGKVPGTHTKDTIIDLTNIGERLFVVAEYGEFREFFAQRVPPEDYIGIESYVDVRTSPAYYLSGGLVPRFDDYDTSLRMWDGRFGSASINPVVLDGDQLLIRQYFYSPDNVAQRYLMYLYGWTIYTHTVDIFLLRQGTQKNVYFDYYSLPGLFGNSSLSTSSFMFGIPPAGLNAYYLSWTRDLRNPPKIEFVPISPSRTLKINGIEITPLNFIGGDSSNSISGDNGMTNKDDCCCDCVEAVASVMEAYMEKIAPMFDDLKKYINKRLVEETNEVKKYIDSQLYKQSEFIQKQILELDDQQIDFTPVINQIKTTEQNLWTGANLSINSDELPKEENK